MEKTNNNTSTNTLSSSFESLSISDLDSFSSSTASFPSPSSTLLFPRYPSFSKMAAGRRSSPRSPGGDGAHHFLDACHLCKKPIGGGRDIFMYRGDTPFCSEDCRQEQIEIDEDDEKITSRSKKTTEKQSMGSKNEKIDVQVESTVVAV